MSYNASRTLPFRIEFMRQVRRRRTLWSYVYVIALPGLVSLASKFGSNQSSDNGRNSFGGGSMDLVGLAGHGAANFTATMLYFATGFVLVTVVAMFCGDTVASDASWATLRYLLAAPVPRTRLLKQKFSVSLLLSLFAVLLLPVASYLIGGLAFGWAPLQSPLGPTFGTWDSIWRLALMSGYVFVSLLFVAGLAFFMGTRTDAPLGAVSAAVIITIISNIMDAIGSLGNARQWLPTHFFYAWLDALSPTIDWTAMLRGASYSLIVFTLCCTATALLFGRKDIVS